MINLEKFTGSIGGVVPIQNNSFQLNRKKYKIEIADGWYKVKVKGNNVESAEASLVDTKHYIPIKGYSYNNDFVFQNFDVAKRKFGIQLLSVSLLINRAPTFSAIHAVPWEDGRLYYAEIDYKDIFIYTIKNAYDQELAINEIKGVTPELKTLYLFHDLQRQQLKAELERNRKEEEKAEWLKTIQGRIQHSFEKVGGELLNYAIEGNRIIVDWKLKSSSQKYNSILDSNTFMVIEAGYCMSGDDRRHSISSMALTAEDYEDNGDIYITRR